jgi:hypothetical protein
MTVGQLIECIVGKIGALEGTEVDGTPFENYDMTKIGDALEKLGYNRTGTEYLYNGMTGKKLQHEIFIGPTYYHRLKHQVEDKIHSRPRGPTVMLTRQAPEGQAPEETIILKELAPVNIQVLASRYTLLYLRHIKIAGKSQRLFKYQKIKNEKDNILRL